MSKVNVQKVPSILRGAYQFRHYGAPSIISSRPMATPVVAGICRGTVGELFQGPAGSSCKEIAIVSALIPRYSRVFFTPVASTAIAPSPPSHAKTFRALEIYCQRNSLPIPKGHWSFASELEVSRGMASSTADMVAMVRCAAHYFKRTVTIEELQAILSKIERSDSVFLDDFVMYCSSHHKVLKHFGKIPSLYALYFHEEKKVDTENTKEILLQHYCDYQADYIALYRNVVNAFQLQSANDICRLSTASAELSQEVIAKRNFSKMYSQMHAYNAEGIIIAHTGSLIGYLFSQRPNLEVIEKVSLFFSQLGGSCQFTEICP